MSWLHRLARAEYVWQPAQLPRRLWRAARRVSTRESVELRLPWGFPIRIDPRELIGRSLVALNTLDLPVTESIWRLLDPGETAADIGANIGYMTSVMAARLRGGGRIMAFEPVPVLAATLRENVGCWRSLSRATIDVQEGAVANTTGRARLHLPATFARNRGEASLVTTATDQEQTSSDCLEVKSIRLDELSPTPGKFDLIKIDVEGGELGVLQGADALLRDLRVRDILLEEHGGPEAPSLQQLRDRGYQVFRVLRRWRGPWLAAANAPAPGELDPPTYLATSNPARARARFTPRGWQVFSGVSA